MADEESPDGDDEEKSFRERVEEIREQREEEREAGEGDGEDPRERMEEMMGGGGPGGMGGGMGGNPFAQMMSGMMGGGGGPGGMGGGPGAQAGPGSQGSEEGGVDTRRLERQVEELRREVGDVTTQLERIADALEDDD